MKMRPAKVVKCWRRPHTVWAQAGVHCPSSYHPRWWAPSLLRLHHTSRAWWTSGSRQRAQQQALHRQAQVAGRRSWNQQVADLSLITLMAEHYGARQATSCALHQYPEPSLGRLHCRQRADMAEVRCTRLRQCQRNCQEPTEPCTSARPAGSAPACRRQSATSPQQQVLPFYSTCSGQLLEYLP